MRRLSRARHAALAGWLAFLALCVSSAASAQSLPASCAYFTDDPVTAGVTVVKAAHVSELRTCVAALRAQSSLPVVNWTDPVLHPRLTVVRAVHLVEIRSALQGVYTARGRTLSFSES